MSRGTVLGSNLRGVYSSTSLRRLVGYGERFYKFREVINERKQIYVFTFCLGVWPGDVH